MFYDWEVLHSQAARLCLSDRAYVAADEESLSKIADEVIAFYEGIPRDLWLYDADGQLPVIVYAYGFPDAAGRHGGLDLVLYRTRADALRPPWTWT